MYIGIGSQCIEAIVQLISCVYEKYCILLYNVAYLYTSMKDKIKFSPFSSETHDIWLFIYIGTLYWIIVSTNMYIKLLLVCLVPRIQQAIHILTHEPNSFINRICHHNSLFGILMSTILAYTHEGIFTTDVVYQKLIHNTHHVWPTDKNKDYTYAYTVAPYKSIEARIRGFFQPEIEFAASVKFFPSIPTLVSMVIRVLVTGLLIKRGYLVNLLVSSAIIRLTRGIFYYQAFHIQHVESDGTTSPLGKNFKPNKYGSLRALVIGQLSVSEAYGHRIHHTYSTKKPRDYNAVPTHES